jgi:4-hydroxybenzoate polyprenyltransferase
MTPEAIGYLAVFLSTYIVLGIGSAVFMVGNDIVKAIERSQK